MDKPLTKAMRRALETAANRERGNVCPCKLHAAAQMTLLNAMERRGLIDMNGLGRGAPKITDAGRAAVATL